MRWVHSLEGDVGSEAPHKAETAWRVVRDERACTKPPSHLPTHPAAEVSHLAVQPYCCVNVVVLGG